MLRCIVVLLVTALALANLGGCGGRGNHRWGKKPPLPFEKWKEYKAPDGSFTVSFPDTVKVEKKVGKSTESVSYDSKSGGEGYHVGVSTALTEDVAAQRHQDPELVNQRAHQFSRQHRVTDAFGERAHEMSWDKKGYNYHGFVFKTHEGHHLYTVWARWKGGPEPENARSFFTSFRTGAYAPKSSPTPSATSTPSSSPGETPDEEDDDDATPTAIPSAGPTGQEK